MIRLTAKAALTNFNATYLIVALFLTVFTLLALFAPSGGVGRANLLMSLSLVAAVSFGLLSGTTLAEIKVKPLSFVMPRQERAMAPAALLVGALICLTYTLLVLLRPMTVVEIPALQQALANFGFSLGLFTLVVAICVVTRDTAFISIASWIPAFLLLGGLNDAVLASHWIALNAALAARPVIALLFAALGSSAVFYLLGNRGLSRNLCGAPFLPLNAYDNPFKMDDYRSRMKSGSFRPGVMTGSGGGPGAIVMAALSRRLTGSSWNYLVLDTRASRNQWEFVVKLVYLGVMLGMIALLMSGHRSYSGLGTLLLLVALTFVVFPPTFKARLSPMLPVARRQHFKAFLAKAVGVYGLVIAALVLLQLVMRMVSYATAASIWQGMAAAAEMPFKGILLVAAAVPILCWAFAKLRSTIGFLVFMMLFFGAMVSVAAFADESLLGQSYAAILIASALCWVPFLLIAGKRCFMDDLLLP